MVTPGTGRAHWTTMNLTHLRRATAILGVAVILAACSAGTDASPSARTTAAPSVSASMEASASPSASPSPSPSASPSPEPTVAATPGPTSTGAPSAFEVAPNPDADALFAIRDICRNPRDGYELEFPEDWYTNTEIRDVPACSWFSPTFYTVDSSEVPDEIAIEIFWIPGGREQIGEILTSDEGLVGGQPAVRLEISGTADGDPEGRSYEYVIQLGPTPEEGPNLVARTDTDMGGDHELNRAVLDRLIATIAFVGSIQ